MAHYAFLDENNIVTEVIRGRDEDEIVDGISDWEKHYGEFCGQKCVRTSFNTIQNRHINNGIPFRKNYAGIGYSWDGTGFASPQPYPSWTKDEATYLWEAPTPMPTDNKRYTWDEEILAWIETE